MDDQPAADRPVPAAPVNPYVAPQVHDAPPFDRKKPGPVAIFFGIVIALAMAGLTFCVSFFFTCLGVMSVSNGPGVISEALVFLIAGLTAIAAFALTLWGFLKVVRSMKS